MPRTNRILIRSGTVAPTASDFAVGEPAFDKSAGKFYLKNAAGSMVEIGAGGGGGSAELVFSYATTANLPATGDASLLYFVTDTGRMFRWVDATTKYVEVGSLGGGGLTWTTAPSGRNATGVAGSLAYDSSWLYIANGTDSWRRLALTWNEDPYLSSVQLLLHGDGTGATFVDSSPAARALTANGDVTQVTTQFKWGGKSIAFDGSSDYISMPYAASLAPGTADFVLEGWFRFTDTNYRFFLGAPANSGSYLMIAINPTGSGQLWMGRSGVDWPVQFSGHSITTNTWYYIAIARSGNSHRLFIDGTQVGSTATYTGSWDVHPSGMRIGHQEGGSSFNGFMDDLRLTIGTARSMTGTTVTVPTAAFPDY